MPRAEPRIETRPLPPRPLEDAPGDLPPLLERAYRARGIDAASELDLGLTNLAPPDGLPDLEAASKRLAGAILGDQHILIVGDFDADGATSVALAVSLLRAFGAQRVSYLVPNRFEFGYGLSEEIVELALRESPDLLVTVDNGVSSIAGVSYANARGVDVIVTDHHLAGAERPAAHAIVNPTLPESSFASRAMAGVGVIYYVLSAVRGELRDAGWFASRPVPNLADWLDLVAIGTIADVVPLDRNNRVLIEQGLRRIRAGRCRPGVRALCSVANRPLSRLSTQDVGFGVGPRLNAAGRLEDMSIGIRCLLADDEKEARAIAAELDELNQTRRAIEQQMVADAEIIVAGQESVAPAAYGVCVYDPSWHQGVVGIVAGRLKDRIYRPVIAFAEAGETAPDEIKGSARSVPGLHVRDALDVIATRYPGLLIRFGGHAMAAGVSLKRVHLDRFRIIFDEVVRERLPEQALDAVLLTDGELALDELSLANARAIAAGGPWGQQFPEPMFHGDFELISQRVVGEEHLKLVVRAGDRLLDAIAFRQPPVGAAERVRMAYRLSENAYRDAVTLQLTVEHIAVLA